MDQNETNSDILTADFGKEVAKAITVSAAISAGTIVGFMAIGLAVVKVQEIKEARKAKKAAKLES